MRGSCKPARVNVTLLIVLAAVSAVAAAALAGGYYARKRVVASRALAAGKAALDRQDWPEACRHLKTYLQRYPDDVEMLARYARAHLAIRPCRPENVGAAIGAYRQYQRLRPGDEEACRELARLYYTIGDFNEAAYVCQRRLAVAPGDVRATVWLGRALMAQRKGDEAAQILMDFVERHPEQTEVYAMLGEIVALGQLPGGPEKALEWLDRGVRKNPRSPEALARRARFHRLVRKDKAAAREDMELADQFRPTSPIALLLLAEGWIDLGELDRAEAELRAIRKIDRETLAAYEIGVEDLLLSQLEVEAGLALRRNAKEEGVAVAERGRKELAENRRVMFLPLAVDLYLAAGAVPEARRCVEEYREALQELAKTDQVFSERLVLLEGIVANAEGKPYYAINLLEEVVVRSSRNARAWRELWYAYSRTGQDRRAHAALKQYVTQQPGDWRATLELAKASVRSRDWATGLRLAREAERLRPDDREARLLRIELMLKGAAGRLNEDQMAALGADLAALQSAAPKATEVRVLQAVLAFYQKKTDEAIQILERAVVECAEPLAASMQLADYLARLQQSDRALAVCRAAVERYPQASLPRITLARLQAAGGRADEAKKSLESAAAELTGEERARAVEALVTLLVSGDEQPAAITWLRRMAEERPSDVAPRLAMLDLPEVQKDPAEMQRLTDEIRTIEGTRGVRWRFEQARLWLRAENWTQRQSEITEQLARCSEADPGWAAPVLILGRTYEVLNKYDKAEDTYRRFVDAYAGAPGHVAVVIRFLEMLERQHRYKEASKILDRMPVNLSAISAHRAKVAIARGDYETAVEELQQRIGTDSRDATARVLLARLLYHVSRDPAPAIKLLDEAQSANPNLLSAVSSRVAILHDENRDAEAVAVLDAEVARRKDFGVYLLRAEFHQMIGQHDLAERDFRHLTTFADSAAEGYASLASFYERTGRVSDAIAALDAGVQSYPDHAGLRRMLIRLLVVSSDAPLRERGRRLLDAALQSAKPGNEDPDLLSVHALLLMREGTPAASKKAIETFERVVQLNPRDVSAHLHLIQKASEAGALTKANELAARAIGANPENVDLLLVRAELESELSNVVAARELAQSILDLEPKNVPARNLLSHLAIRAGDVDGAARINDEARKLDPASEDVQVARAEILNIQGRREQAVEYLAAYCRSVDGRRSVKAILALADLYRMQSDFAAAEEQIRAAGTLAPDSVGVFLMQVRCLASQSRFDDILAALAVRREKHALEPQVLISVASILSAANAERYLREAKSLFEQYVLANPAAVEGYLGLAMIALQLGQAAEAENAYRKLLEVAPYHQHALNNLAWILQDRLRNPEEALQFANRGVRRYPNDPHLLNTRGVTYYRLVLLKEAQRDLQKSMELAVGLPSTRARSLYYLGRIHAQQGERELARAVLDEALKIDRQQSVFTPEERGEIQKLLGGYSN